MRGCHFGAFADSLKARSVHPGSKSSCSAHGIHPTHSARVRSYTSIIPIAYNCESPVGIIIPTRLIFLEVVLADKYDRYQMTYEGCHVFNPGSFLGNSFGFSAYIPARRESEEWYVSHSPWYTAAEPGQSIPVFLTWKETTRYIWISGSTIGFTSQYT